MNQKRTTELCTVHVKYKYSSSKFVKRKFLDDVSTIINQNLSHQTQTVRFMQNFGLNTGQNCMHMMQNVICISIQNQNNLSQRQENKSGNSKSDFLIHLKKKIEVMFGNSYIQ